MPTFSRYCRRSATASRSFSASTFSYRASRDLPSFHEHTADEPKHSFKTAFTSAARRAADTHGRWFKDSDRSLCQHRLSAKRHVLGQKVGLQFVRRSGGSARSHGRGVAEDVGTRCDEQKGSLVGCRAVPHGRPRLRRCAWEGRCAMARSSRSGCQSRMVSCITPDATGSADQPSKLPCQNGLVAGLWGSEGRALGGFSLGSCRQPTECRLCGARWRSCPLVIHRYINYPFPNVRY